ncbi:HNH endonuclease family protein [Streptomyces sp. NPDC017993]|uniref:HNH endonuclease family protein n=1 Tax=Streptomyces sp. NPDC017993 TaxID=3365027 RepID=UPI0037BC1D63
MSGGPAGLDIDHMEPLAEAWDSVASKWTDERSERYANDLDAHRSLVAVSSGPNPSKGDQDPAEWKPPAKCASCTYATDWVTAKPGWKLTIDHAEGKALAKLATSCTEATVKFTRDGARGAVRCEGGDGRANPAG